MKTYFVHACTFLRQTKIDSLHDLVLNTLLLLSCAIAVVYTYPSCTNFSPRYVNLLYRGVLCIAHNNIVKEIDQSICIGCGNVNETRKRSATWLILIDCLQTCGDVSRTQIAIVFYTRNRSRAIDIAAGSCISIK